MIIKNMISIRLLSIYASIGFILFVVGCSSIKKDDLKPTVVNIPANEMINIPWNHGWSVAISATPGIPIELLGSDKVEYEILGDYNQLVISKDGMISAMSKTETTLKAEDHFYWRYDYKEHDEERDEFSSNITDSWINIIRKQDGYPTGLVLIKISDVSDKKENLNTLGVFKAEIVASLAFPMQDGAYHHISHDELKELEAYYKNKL